ncbi:sensor histidine kinase [Dyella sp. A6]|uniref:sensor histidine kinase n=1 Tax=Dyella aluminiiresistens TaxID=3069105 RepID=UPI002E776F68|nr:ATP-binding protein [Dyella sp. A6]
MKWRSLSWRITLLLLATSLLVFAGGSLVMDHLVDHQLKLRFYQGLELQSQALAASMELEPWHVEPDNAAWLSAGLLGDAAIHYDIRCGGRELDQSRNPPPGYPPGWPAAAGMQPQIGELLLADGRHMGWTMRAFRMPLGEGWGHTRAEREQRWRTSKHIISRDCRLLLMQDRGRLDDIMLSVDGILVVGPLLALLIALLAVPLIVRRGLRPLGRLGDRMGDIGPHEPGRRLAPTGMYELDPLVARFNEVLARMDDGLARERQFASGLAHETRTRLAELRVMCEVETRYPSGRPLPDLLTELGTIGTELENTVNALLLLTRLQSGLEQAHFKAQDPTAQIERLLQRHESVARERDITLRLERITKVTAAWQIDPALLEVVLGNLLGNACHYASAGDTVVVRIDETSITVDNAAPNLDESDLVHFGQRFWRKQPTHSGHAGLGLALARAAAQAMQLQLEYQLSEGRLQSILRRVRHMDGDY